MLGPSTKALWANSGKDTSQTGSGREVVFPIGAPLSGRAIGGIMPRYEAGHFIANVARPSQQRTPPSTSTALDVSSISLIAVGEVDPDMAVLAQPLACLVGRDHERCAVVELLVVRRLVTLCGPGGVG